MRRILARIVLLAVPTAIGCSSDPGTSSQSFNLLNSSCVSHLSFHVDVDDIEHASLPAQLRIESCRVDVDACTDLCSFELAEIASKPTFKGYLQPGGIFNGGQPVPDDLAAPPVQGGRSDLTNGFVPTKCTVKFDGNSMTAEIGVDSPVVSNNCAFAATAGTGMGGVK